MRPALEKTLSRAEVLAGLRADYDRAYFVNGNMRVELYEPDCRFEDPFVGFEGTARFKTNVENLGPFLQNVRLDVLSFDERPQSVNVRWRFICDLDLPWRPRLAASGSTEHFFSETGRVERHVEVRRRARGSLTHGQPVN